ncbi:hypothetical protein KAFR_0D02560 [Kazachstania africana CBS 2517]|uniref:Transcription factor IIIC subunit 5 HTH domain-containing protein n=1 Tax=Kazachstania africana (strain ATCC 22294 / BCRC 22015 / CBS 2517 / CECT 1963 / NBRC 1671 / NRRL Y-8276) TaxID=1071382 RepID=H2AU53_KAZAF|nr:hypothetical protein KAFR_0D02560 [Kazachstania africana CBS 2517]CCF57903.1 hypothetical protein KAFR_0D02560 [Kazachstania africana CBS 2517]
MMANAEASNKITSTDILEKEIGSTDEAGPLAKEYTLDIPRIPSLELPLHVSSKQESVQRAIDMCGGLPSVKEAFREHGSVDSQKGLELYLNKLSNNKVKKSDRDEFFNEHPIVGKRVPYRDDSIILKVSVPKGTMAKNDNNIRKALSSLEPKDYKVTPVGIVNNTIKFREMSDFQIMLDNVPAANEYLNSFKSLEWDNFKNFVQSVPDYDPRPYENINNIILDRIRPCPNTDFQLPPPPRLSMVGFPHLYKYKKNPFATKKSNGKTEVKGSYLKNYQLFAHSLEKTTKIPSKPHPKLQKEYEIANETKVFPGTKADSKFYDSLEECIEVLNGLFEKRPIWVKRHIDGIIDKKIHHTLKIALALTSYRFTTGPWRNTYIKFGVDPRTSSEYAKYQTEYFKIERRLLSSPLAKNNIPKIPATIFKSNISGWIDDRFIFDGTQVPWYLMLQIDLLIREPNIAEVYNNAKYLDKPNVITGWFHELDLVKIRKIVKYELGCLAQGNNNFNKYKLKYFKSIQFTKESMITGGAAANTGDAEGDIDMTREESKDNVTEDEDNGVAAEEADEGVLEAEEIEADDVTPIDNEDEDDGIIDGFDPETATFQDIIAQISKMDPSSAERLQNELEGFVNENKL